MSKKDKLKEEIGILRDDYKNYFIIFMAIITASFTSFYQVILKNVPNLDTLYCWNWVGCFYHCDWFDEEKKI
jgi:hypothetical protein